MEPKNMNEGKKSCNCSDKEECPVNQNCLIKTFYTKPLYSYNGLCESTFKQRYNGHKKSFNNEKYKSDRAPSKEV